MIITRTPLRISLGGGGTDLPSYYEKFGGFVISAAIDKHVYITNNRTYRPGYHLKYAKMESVETYDQIEHGILREALRLLAIPSHQEIVSIADVPAGTGLGSSGSFTVGLLHALYALLRRPIGTSELARTASHLEMNILGEPCGKQDHYIAAYGGIICQEYRPDGTVEITQLGASEETVRDLHEGLMLFFTGYSRTAAGLLAEQKEKSQSDDGAMLENLHFIKDLGRRIKQALERGETMAFGEMMHEHWMRKRQRSEAISSPRIDELYELGRRNGAIGGKLVGAGGGGFLLFYTNERQRLRQALAATELVEMDFSFDFNGSLVLLRN